MKLFASKFYQTLILNVATIAAIIVGIVQFAVRAYNENNGNEKVRRFAIIVLNFIDNVVNLGLDYLHTASRFPDPLDEVAQPITEDA
jgi:hypothetical protein